MQFRSLRLLLPLLPWALACGDIVLPGAGGNDTGTVSPEDDSSSGTSETKTPGPGLEDVTVGPQADTESPTGDALHPDGDDPDAASPDVLLPAGPGTPCATGAECASGFCVDGVCCYTACDAECMACTTALSGLPEGSCGPVQAGSDPKGTCPDDGAPSCGRTGVCDGKGACAQYSNATTCGATSCTDGVRTLAGTCDGQGQCTPGPTEPCAPFACSGNACAGECSSDQGCSAETWCDVSTGACVAKKAQGDKCQNGKGSHCESGFCVDGVCCESACDETCTACAALLTGAADGECRPAKDGTDPDSECADLGSAACATDGMCDGAGSCRLVQAATACVPGVCALGVATAPSLCDGAGACIAGTTTSCAPFACAGAVCAVECASGTDCSDGAYCEGGTCVATLATGAPCQSSSSCATGWCVDGVCCDGACVEACSACSAALTEAGDGTCAPVRGSTDPHGNCADLGAASCGTTGLCDAAGACAIYAAGTLCGSSSCSAGSELVAPACDGAGGCVASPAASCAPYTCGSSACKDSCDVDADCVAGHFCQVGACVPRLVAGAECSAANQCASGNCVDGVCCDTACGGLCEACSTALKGSGADGVCQPVGAGLDHGGECADSGATSCGTDGVCNGAGACRLYGAGAPCGDAGCSGGKATEASACDGEGTCVGGPSQVCSPFACDGLGCHVGCSTPAECEPGNACIDEACVGLLDDGAVCADGLECRSGHCTDGVCCNSACGGTCQACRAVLKGGGADGSCGPIDAGSDPGNECAATGAETCGTIGACDGSGACALHGSVAVCAAAACSSGVASAAANCNGAGACLPGPTTACGAYGCAATACRTKCNQNSDCASGFRCSPSETCVPFSGLGEPCTGGAQCTSGHCVEGVCCDGGCTGLCRSCLAAKKGGGLDGVCGEVAVGQDPDSECTDQGTSTCGNDGTCNGAGACRKYAAGTECKPPTCAAGKQTTAGVCNGSGSCNNGTSTNCTPYVCGATACLATCTKAADCSSGTCLNGACGGKLGNGAACIANSECSSSNCVDSVCCNTGCTGACQACSALRKGSGTDGTCGAVVVGTDPDDDCGATPASGCGLDGSCDGAGACRLHPTGTTCSAASCSAGTATPAGACTGTGTCAVGAAKPCAPYACGAAACNTTCSTAADCAGGQICLSGACVSPLANGAACSTGVQCSSTFCVDGVCCSGACTGICKACNVAGFVGTCSNVAVNTDPASECALQSASTCGTTGVCNGAGACQKYPAGTVCTAGSCASGVQSADGTCNGSGICTAGATTSCSPYVCGATACAATCAGDATCVAAAYCAGGKCLPKASNGSECSTAASCTSGHCVDGVCCDGACTGTCVACSNVKTGSTDGKCTSVKDKTDPDNECAAAAAGTCGQTGLCGDAGTCALYDSATQCIAPSCSGGVQVAAGICNGLGTCAAGASSQCSPFACGGTACTTTCVSDTNCAPGHYCSSGACLPLKANGVVCTVNGQCSSASCVDGVCCDSACTGTCRACSKAKTGSPDGTCTNVGSGADPDNECTDNGASKCEQDGACSGSGSCRIYSSGTVCIAASCASGSQTSAGLCDGAGNCKAGTASACTPYACGTSACVTSCTSSSNCVAGYVCNASKCILPLANGSTCTSAAVCSSGFCVDGVCCGSACTGTCKACSAAKTGYEDGVCEPIDGWDPDDECSGTSLCCFGICRQPSQCLL